MKLDKKQEIPEQFSRPNGKFSILAELSGSRDFLAPLRLPDFQNLKNIFLFLCFTGAC